MAHWHTIRQGESLPSIAERYGFNDWSVIYEHGENGELRSLRPDPNVLAPGDKVFVPNKEQKYVEVGTEQAHRFQLSRRMEKVRLSMEDADGRIFDFRPYELKVGNLIYSGQTDASGLLEEEVPAIADEAELTLWVTEDQPITWKLSIGGLDPADTVSGIQQRLTNLGFVCGHADGVLDQATEAAVLAFQEKAGLEMTGVIDDATRQAVVDAHGS